MTPPLHWPALTTGSVVATDGHRFVWVPLPDAQSVLRIEMEGAAILPIALEEHPVALGITGAESCVVAMTSPGVAGARLVRIEGGEVEPWGALPEAPLRMIGDRAGGIWAALANGPHPATLVHLDANATVDVQAPLGIFPRALRHGADDSVWVFCAIPPQLRRFDAAGGLQLSIDVPATTRDFLVGPLGSLLLAREAEGIVEVRDSDGGSALALTLGGHPRSLMIDGRERLWVIDGIASEIRRYPQIGSDTPDLVLAGGAGVAIGTEQGMDVAAGAGAGLDADRDGVPTEIERDWRFDPFDASDSPCSLSFVAGAAPHVALRAPACPGRMAWFGVAREARPYGAGALGSSLAGDDLFDWFQVSGAPSFVPTIFAMIPASGELVLPVQLPSGPGLSGFRFWAAGLVLEENFSFEGALASAAVEVVIP